jgi:hypothetical protein
MLDNFFRTCNVTDYNPKIFQTITTIAQDIQGDGNARVVAAVVHRHRNIISVGHNSRQSHPFQLRYGRNKDSIFWHAETHAIYNALRREPISMLEKCWMYVVRLKRPQPFSKKWIPGLFVLAQDVKLAFVRMALKMWYTPQILALLMNDFFVTNLHFFIDSRL